jgi:hypothetical protein
MTQHVILDELEFIWVGVTIFGLCHQFPETDEELMHIIVSWSLV